VLYTVAETNHVSIESQKDFTVTALLTQLHKQLPARFQRTALLWVFA